MSLSLQMRCKCGLIDAERAVPRCSPRPELDVHDLTKVLEALADQGARQDVERRTCCRWSWALWWWCARRAHKVTMVCPSCGARMEVPTSLEGRDTMFPVDPEWRRGPQ